MTERFDLAIRMGTRDTAPVPGPANGWTRRDLDFVSGRRQLGFGIGRFLQDAAKDGLLLSEAAIDLLVLASAVYAADTRIARSQHSQDGWTREIRLSVPVADPALWNANAKLLERTLRFLSGDIWGLSFRARPPGFGLTAPKPNMRARRALRHDCACLFSGGLDSLVGAIDLLSQERSPLLVSHASEGATSKAQKECHTALRVAYPLVPHNRLRAWIQFERDLIDGGGNEDTTRARSFLFFALGVLAASGLNADGCLLVVPENGFISLNVPLEPLRVGSLSTRTTHPFYMARWQEIIARIGVGCDIANPYQLQTKGEMIEHCGNGDLLKRLIPRSMSCSSPSKARWSGGPPIQHCGYCVPCLIRRAAIVSALGTDPTDYTVKRLEAQPLSTLRAEGEQIRAFKYAAKKIADDPKYSRAAVLMTGPLADLPDGLQAASDLYTRGLLEVSEFLKDVEAQP